MKYEFVGFYPEVEKKKRDKNLLGTCHIYAIDLEIDIRGILVKKTPRGFFYHFPHGWQFDPETKKKEKFPIFRFTNQEKHKELLGFMFNEVTPKIKEILNPCKIKIA